MEITEADLEPIVREYSYHRDNHPHEDDRRNRSSRAKQSREFERLADAISAAIPAFHSLDAETQMMLRACMAEDHVLAELNAQSRTRRPPPPPEPVLGALDRLEDLAVIVDQARDALKIVTSRPRIDVARRIAVGLLASLFKERGIAFSAYASTDHEQNSLAVECLCRVAKAAGDRLPAGAARKSIERTMKGWGQHNA